MNTDQGNQYTGYGWITTLTEAKIKISMDGRGRYLDNIFIESLWLSLKSHNWIWCFEDWKVGGLSG
ncbi:hypothetical protein N9C16_07550 [Paracoccaceae bacterium]|nr:hypothetical protein [Paracoccaceae bacterium]